MLTREQKAKKSAIWLVHWQGWQESGVSMAEYARGHGFDAQEAYRWKRILNRTGQWIDADGATVAAPVAPKKIKVAPRFARVAVSDAPAPPTSMVLRLVLGNGRRAEFEVLGMTQLAELIGVLERAA
jgi:transposase-like protein